MIVVSSDMERIWFQPSCIVVCLAICCLINQIARLYILTGLYSMVYLVVYLYMMEKSPMSFCLCTWDVHILIFASNQVPATKQKCTPLNYNCSNVAESCQCFCKCDIYTPYMRTAGGEISCFYFSQKWFKFLTLYKKVFINVAVLEWIK